jgi:rhamnose transport system permease protein
VLAVITAVVLRMTPLGRSLYAIGLNQEAAFHAGIRVKRIKLGLYVLSGVVCALVGMLYAFELSSAGENIGIGFELQVITIVLLGGVSIFGGRGTILGVTLAAFIYAGLRSALLLGTSINENDYQVVSGALLILSVLVPNAATLARRANDLFKLRAQRQGSLRTDTSG